MDRIFASLAMRRLLEQVDRIGRRDFAVLITGETGVGKEVVARLVHERSGRAASALIDFSCAAIPEPLIESELFGYEQGAFSGALRAKPGLFELAHGGTLLLDEIGELPKTSQAKLLRVLDRMPYYRLGGTRKIAADVRILAATNQDLENAVKAGSFRADLYYRLAEVQLRIPPLRDRVADIGPLACQFLARSSPGYTLSPDAIKELENYSWPGNVRELRNAVIAAAMESRSERLTAAAFSGVIRHDPEHQAHTLDAVERTMIMDALGASGGNRMRAAARLGISRRTLSRKIREYGAPSQPSPPPAASDLMAFARAIRAWQQDSSLTREPVDHDS